MYPPTERSSDREGLIAFWGDGFEGTYAGGMGGVVEGVGGCWGAGGAWPG